MSDFASSTSNAATIPLGAPNTPTIAASAIGAARLSEKSLELTFCAQFSAELFHRHYIPWSHRMVWFGLTQLQERQLGFDAVTSLGGFAVIFQFKASHTVTRTRGRRFKVEHRQMQTLKSAFGHHPHSCFYVFPDVGTVNELLDIHSDVIGHSWLVDVANIPNPIPAPTKTDGSGPRKDNCHFAYLGNPPGGDVEFHSDVFRVRAYKAKEVTQRLEFPERLLRTNDVVRLVKGMNKRFPDESRRVFRNTVMAVLADHF